MNKTLRKKIAARRQQAEALNLKIAAELRAQRKAAGVSAKCVAGEIGLSTSFLCDLEKGRRQWNKEFYEAYCEAVKKLRRTK